MKAPKVSVIMPAYNVERYIGEAIESILNQTFTDFELIILNDYSTDKTLEIIKKYARKDKRIKFKNNQKNMGFIASLNRCLDIAQGKYIAKMDSDDISLPTRLEKQVAYLDNHPEVGLVGVGYRAFEKANFEVIFPPLVGFADFLKNCSTTAFMLRKKIIDNYHLRFRKEYLYTEDYDFYTRFIRYANIHNIPEVLYLYRWHGKNISITQKAVQEQNTNKVKNNILNFLTADSQIQRKIRELFDPRFEKTYQKYYPFDFLPIFRIKQKLGTKKYYLLNFILIFKIKSKKNKTNCYLFGFIPFLKVKGKIK